MYIPAARTCGIGQAKVCGLPVVGAVSVHPISDALDEIQLTPGIVYLCERHYRQPLGLAEEVARPTEERDEAQATIERVRALIDDPQVLDDWIAISKVRAAIAQKLPITPPAKPFTPARMWTRQGRP